MTHAESSPRRRTISRAAIATLGLVGIAAGGLTGIHRTSHDSDTPADNLRAAQALAQRYDCQIESINPEQPVDATGRRRLSVAVKLSDKLTVLPILKERRSSADPVHWQNPVLGAYIGNDAAANKYYPVANVERTAPFAQERPNRYDATTDDYTGIMRVELRPRSDYPDGTVANVVVANEVHVDVSPTEVRPLTGYESCGTLELSHGAWVVSERPSTFEDRVVLDVARP